MSMRLALVFFLTCASASSAWAWDPLKSAGRSLGAGAGEALQPVLTNTVDHAAAAAGVLVTDVHVRASSLIDKSFAEAHGVLADVDTRAGKLVDRAGDKANQVLTAAVDHVDATLDKRIFQLGDEASKALNRADKILRERSDQLGRLVQDRLVQADGILSERIEQLDEAVGRRLGNVDVIATKQRLAIEATAIRVAVLVGGLVFLVFVLVSLWRRYPDILAKVGDKRGVYRAWGFAIGIARPLGLQLLGAGMAIAVLVGLYCGLPLGASKQAAATVARHETALKQSLARFDFTRARFHAAQLELLNEADSFRYQAQAAKAELLRDLLARPLLLTSEAGLRTVTARVEDIERKLGANVDPDVLTLKAMVLWQVGGARVDEYEAASLCTRALRTPGQDFALAPLARHYVRAFLDAPTFTRDTPLDRQHESATAIMSVLAGNPGDAPEFPLAPALALNRAMLDVDREVSAAYWDMLRAHARVKAEPPLPVRSARAPAPEPKLTAAHEERRLAAQAVLDAWKKFDQTVQGISGLVGNPSVLAMFRLNDATYTRAAWFIENPGSAEVAPLAANLTNLDAAKAKRFSPPRVEWERRYRALLDDSLKGVFAFQEADRFRAFDTQARAFELAFVEQQRNPSDPKLRLSAAQAATALGLFVPMPREQRQEILEVATQLGLYLPPTASDSRVAFALVLLSRASQAQASQTGEPRLIKAAYSERLPLAPKADLQDLSQLLSIRHLRLL